MILQLLPFWILFGVLSAYFAHKRGRNPRVWFIMGLFLGLFGLLTLFILPTLKSAYAKQPVEVSPPLSHAIPPKNSSLDKPWFFVRHDGQREGPIYFADLRRAWISGHFNAQSLIWCEGMDTWKKVQDLYELHEELSIK